MSNSECSKDSMLILFSSHLLSVATAVTSRNVRNKNGFLYANVLACIDETSQTAWKIANIRGWIGAFEDTNDDSIPKADLEYM